MIRLHQIKLSLAEAAYEPWPLRALAASRLQVPAADIRSAHIARRSVDARDQHDVHFTLSLDVVLKDPSLEQTLIRRFRPNQAVWMDTPKEYDIFHLPATPYDTNRPRPVVIGAGPAGLFCALGLAVRGAKPIILERGKRVDERVQDVAALWNDGILNPESNVLFGEGGAGAFSDGKLTCGLNDPLIRTVLHTFTACGAPEEIMTDARPHIGTDLLRGVLENHARQAALAWRGDPLSMQGNGPLRGRRAGDRRGNRGGARFQPTRCIWRRGTARATFTRGLPRRACPWQANRLPWGFALSTRKR